MKTIWFKNFGWFYLPIHPLGYLLSLLGIIFLVLVCVSIVRDGSSLTDNLYHIFVYGTCTTFWWKWVAENTSE